MTVTFEQPTGVHRDIKELEFTTAVMQTDMSQLRQSGGLKPEDIALYLRSRHGITVDEKLIVDLVFRDMGGGEIEVNNKNEQPLFDIVQLVATIMIPEVLKAATSENAHKQPMFVKVFDNLFQKGQPLNRETLRKAFQMNGETEVADDLLDEMVNVASGKNGKWNPKYFAQVLAHDLTSFDLAWVGSKTTVCQDICGANCPEEPEKDSGIRLLQRSWTSAGVDSTADTHKRPVLNILIWLLAVLAYFSHIFGQDDWAKVDCDGFTETGCQILSGMTVWLGIFVQLCTLGLVFIVGASLSNSVYADVQGTTMHNLKTVAATIVSIFIVGIATIVPYFQEFVSAWWETWGRYDKEVDDIFMIVYQITFGLGCVVVFLLLWDLLIFLLPAQSFSAMRDLFLPGGVRAEAALKQAAGSKVASMIEHALFYHHSTDKETSSGASQALVRFHLDGVKSEKIGGVVWAWKNLFSGRLTREYGVWIHSRVMACFLAQIVVCFMYIYFTCYIFRNKEDFVDTSGTSDTSEDTYSTSPEETYASTYIADPTLAAIYQASGGLDMSKFVNGTSWYTDVDAAQMKSWTCIYTAFSVYSYLGATPDYFAFSQIYSECDPEYGLRDVLASALVNATAYVDGSARKLQTLSTMNPTFVPSTLTGFESTLEPTLAPTMASSYYDDDGVEGPYLEMTNVQFTVSLLAGALAAVASSLYISLHFVPNYVSTVLKFRSGVIPSLGSPYFFRYRFAPDVVTILFGSAWWGALVGSALAGAVFGGLMSVLTGGFGGDITEYLLGVVTGFVVILIVKMIVLSVLRKYFFSAFYRKGSPATGNLWFVAQEVWNIALSFAFIVVRIVKILLVAIFFIARVDTPFMAEGVGVIGPIVLDSYPVAFRKNVLLSEAHRNVLIERLGHVTLLKLKCSNTFAKRPGSIWRLLYVLALMPWLRRYRIKAGDIERTISDKDHHADNTEFADEVSQWMLHAPKPTNAEHETALIQELQHRNQTLEMELDELRNGMGKPSRAVVYT